MTTVVKIPERDTAAPLAASELDIMKHQLNAPSAYDFVAATRTVAMFEAIAQRLNVVGSPAFGSIDGFQRPFDHVDLSLMTPHRLTDTEFHAASSDS